MSSFYLKDPSLSSSMRVLFHFQIGQRVCVNHPDGTPDLSKVGEIIDGLREDEGNGQGGPYSEKYKVRLENGEVIVLNLTQISEAPELASRL